MKLPKQITQGLITEVLVCLWSLKGSPGLEPGAKTGMQFLPYPPELDEWKSHFEIKMVFKKRQKVKRAFLLQGLGLCSWVW